jgi:hypothetical protein
MRLAPSSTGDILALMSRVFPPAVALLLSCCGDVAFDFGVPDTDADAAACPAVAADPAGCAGETAPCFGTATVRVAPVDRAAGCAPAGLPVGAVRFDPSGATGGVDLLVWAAPSAPDRDPFRDGCALALFGDACGDVALGKKLDCAYEPWLLARGLNAADAVFLHVQAGEEGALDVGWELRPTGTWSPVLPSAGEPLDCDGTLEDPLVIRNPWNAPVDLDLSRVAPPAGRDPWICGRGASGWRQVGLALHNPYDARIRLTGVRLEKGDGAPVLFHFALASCAAIGASPIEVSSCSDPGDDHSKSVDAGLEPWVPGDEATEYALVIQVPPSQGVSFTLTLEADLGP